MSGAPARGQSKTTGASPTMGGSGIETLPAEDGR